MIKKLAAEANGNFSQENGKVGTVQGLRRQCVKGGKKFVDRIASLLIGQPLDKEPRYGVSTHRGLQLHQ